MPMQLLCIYEWMAQAVLGGIKLGVCPDTFSSFAFWRCSSLHAYVYTSRRRCRRRRRLFCRRIYIYTHENYYRQQFKPLLCTITIPDCRFFKLTLPSVCIHCSSTTTKYTNVWNNWELAGICTSLAVCCNKF